MPPALAKGFFRSSCLLAFAMALAVGVAVPSAADEARVRAVVVIDVTKAGAQGKDRLTWPKSPTWVTATPEHAALSKLTVSLKAFSDANTLKAEKEFLENLTSLPPATDPTRIVSKAGDEILLLLLADYLDDHEPVSVVKETKRLTQLAQDLEKLITTVTKGVERQQQGAVPPVQPTVRVVAQRITLAERRATVAIGARSVRTKNGSTTIADDSCKNDDCIQRSLTVSTGPVESLFLSLDLPVTKVSDVVYDSASRTLQPKTTPTVVFLGLDYVPFGDVLTKPRSVGLSSVVLKGFIKLSSRPSDAWGFGLGFRPPALDLGGIKLDLFQAFGAYVWTRQDRVAASGDQAPGSSYKPALRAGVSFNLDKLGDWLKL